LTLAVEPDQVGSTPACVNSKSTSSPTAGSACSAVRMPGLLPGPIVPAPPIVAATLPVPASRAPEAIVKPEVPERA
jgi:hypothetical protein